MPSPIANLTVKASLLKDGRRRLIIKDNDTGGCEGSYTTVRNIDGSNRFMVDDGGWEFMPYDYARHPAVLSALAELGSAGSGGGHHALSARASDHLTWPIEECHPANLDRAALLGEARAIIDLSWGELHTVQGAVAESDLPSWAKAVIDRTIARLDSFSGRNGEAL